MLLYYIHNLICHLTVGRLVIWDKVTESRRAILPVESRGIGAIIAVGNCVYVGCKAAYTVRRPSTSKGHISDITESHSTSKLYIVNALQHQIIEVSGFTCRLHKTLNPKGLYLRMSKIIYGA